MAKYLMAQENSRIIPKEDKIFGINKLAKEMIAKEGKENVVNAARYLLRGRQPQDDAGGR